MKMLQDKHTHIFIFIASVISVGTFAHVYAQTRSGCHIASQAEADVSPNAIIAGKSEVCTADTALGITNTVGEAKDYLLSIAKGLAGTQAPPDKAHIDKLNNTFAVCAANFFKAYSSKYGKVTISSAYRDGPSGENARAGGAPGGNHTRGVAIDAYPAGSTDSAYKIMWKFASDNPSFGVCFPHQDGTKSTGYKDPPHMILAGIGGNESASCAAQGVTKACSGAPVYAGNLRYGTSQATSSGNCTSVNGCTSNNSGLGTYGTADDTLCPYGYSNSNNTCIQQSCSGNGGYTVTNQEPLTFSCAQNQSQGQQQNKQSQSGTSGSGSRSSNSGSSRDTGSTVNPISSIFTPSLPGSSTSTSTATTSASDFLTNYLNTSFATTTSTSTNTATSSIIFNLNKSDIASLTVPSSNMPLSPSAVATITSISNVQSLMAPQTFTSTDLQTSNQDVREAPSSTFSNTILNNLHSILLTIAQYLAQFRKKVKA